METGAQGAHAPQVLFVGSISPSFFKGSGDYKVSFTYYSNYNFRQYVYILEAFTYH